MTNVCGESCVSCQLRVVLFPSLPITAPLFHCSPCPSQLTRISGLTGSRPTTAPSNNLPLPPFHPMSSLYTHVTKNNQTRLWSQTAAAPPSLSYRPIFLSARISFHRLSILLSIKNCYSLPLPPPSLHSICILKPRIHDSYSGSP